MHWIWCIVFDENEKQTKKQTVVRSFDAQSQNTTTRTLHTYAYLVYTIGLNRICAHASGPFAHGHPYRRACQQCRWFLFYIGKLCRCCIQTCIASHWFGLFSTDIYDILQILSILKHKPLITVNTVRAVKGDRATQFHCILILIQIRFCLLQAKRDVQCIFGLAWSRTLLVYAPAVARIKYLELFLQTIFFPILLFLIYIYVPAVCV